MCRVPEVAEWSGSMVWRVSGVVGAVQYFSNSDELFGAIRASQRNERFLGERCWAKVGNALLMTGLLLLGIVDAEK